MPLKLIGELKPRPTDNRQLPYDPYVDRIMKETWPDLYQEARMKRRHQVTAPLLLGALKKYDRGYASFNNMNPREKVLMKLAMKDAQEAFKLNTKVQPLSWAEAMNLLDHSTSSGHPHYRPKGMVLDEIYKEARIQSHFLKRTTDPFSVPLPPCAAFKRTHVSDRDTPKTRLIWGYPASITVMEMKFAGALNAGYRAQESPIWNTGRFAHRIEHAIGTSSPDKYEFFNLDWSAFDTSVPNFLIFFAFDTLGAQVDWDNWNGMKAGPAEKLRWINLWNAIKLYFVHTPIVMPNGDLYRKSHGIPSGSNFTQLIGTICNYVVIRFLILKSVDDSIGVDIGSRNVGKDIKALGDDSHFKLTKETAAFIRLDEWALTADRLFMMKLNPEKCARGRPEDVKFLGFRYRDGHIFREPVEWLTMALYPEASDLSPTGTYRRLLGLLVVSGGMSDVLCILHDLLVSRFDVDVSGFSITELPRGLRRFVSQVFDYTEADAIFRTALSWVKLLSFV